MKPHIGCSLRDFLVLVSWFFWFFFFLKEYRLILSCGLEKLL